MPYCCELCPFTTRRRDNLTTHIGKNNTVNKCTVLAFPKVVYIQMTRSQEEGGEWHFLFCLVYIIYMSLLPSRMVGYKRLVVYSLQIFFLDSTQNKKKCSLSKLVETTGYPKKKLGTFFLSIHCTVGREGGSRGIRKFYHK